MTQSTKTKMYALQITPPTTKSVTTLPAHDQTVAAQKRVSPKMQTNTNGTITTMAKVEGGVTGKMQKPFTVSEYNTMLMKELNYRLWHNVNLGQTITRNLADYDCTEQQLRALIRIKKQQYESSLDELFGHDLYQKQNVHHIIGVKLQSSPNRKSGTMEKAENVLKAGRSALVRNQSFDQWRLEMDEFLKNLQNAKALSINEHVQIRLFALRNLVEIAKVNENRLLLELQVMAEQYHQKLGTLREEFNWWRRRFRELQNMRRNGNYEHSEWTWTGNN